MIVPLLGGSGFDFDPSLRPIEGNSGVAGAVNEFQDTMQPAWRIRAPAYTNWFNRANLLQAFQVTDYWGQQPSFGQVQWQYAQGSVYRWPFSKIARMVISWGRAGTPVLVDFVLVAYGGRQTGLSLSPTRPWGVPLMSQDIQYPWSFEKVEEGRILLDNRLSPDLSLPRWSSVDLNPYPYNYKSDVPRCALEIVQHNDGLTLDSDDPRIRYLARVRFNDSSGTQVTQFNLTTSVPSRQHQVTGYVGCIRRIYHGIKPNHATPLFSWS